MKLEIPEKKKHVHDMTFHVRWGDMDAMGHVNNAMYFRYMETARIEWMQKIDALTNPQGHGPVIVNAFCNFYRQLEYPDEVLLRTYVSGAGRSSFDAWTTMARVNEPEVICAAGGATVVWTDFPAQKSAPMPDWLRAHLE